MSSANKPVVKCARCGGDTKDLDDIDDCYPNPITLIIRDKEGSTDQNKWLNFCSWCHSQMDWKGEVDWSKGIWKGRAL